MSNTRFDSEFLGTFFYNPSELNNEELDMVYKFSKLFDEYKGLIREELVARLKNNPEFSTSSKFELSYRKAPAKWKNESETIRELAALDHYLIDIIKPRLKSPLELEKAVGFNGEEWEDFLKKHLEPKSFFTAIIKKEGCDMSVYVEGEN